MSVVRGQHLVEPAFSALIENDGSTHWLWGKYRFLSGDDKSTWYYLLKERAEMFYVPDALTITIEYIQGSAAVRMKENLRRWSGNTLRNGARAIALGPKTTGFFIWWCLIDQRIAIWTMPCGLVITLLLSVKLPAFFLTCLLWFAFTRLCLASVLFYHARRIDMGFPFLLFFNQFVTSLIKISILFRLPQQCWQNRGGQNIGFNRKDRWRGRAAMYLTLFYCLGFLYVILWYLHFIGLPTWTDLQVLLS
jgi:glycosyltransferase Alg8